MQKEKRLTLNAEKRKTIENVFQSHWEREDSPVVQEWTQAKNTYDTMKPKVYELVNNVVRLHQPQEDVDTIRSMISKYSVGGYSGFFQSPVLRTQSTNRSTIL